MTASASLTSFEVHAHVLVCHCLDTTFFEVQYFEVNGIFGQVPWVILCRCFHCIVLHCILFPAVHLHVGSSAIAFLCDLESV